LTRCAVNKLANSLLSLAVAATFAILVFGVYRWISGALFTVEVVLYVLVPAVTVGLLLPCFRLAPDKKAAVALCLVGVGVAVYAAEAYLVLSGRPHKVELEFVKQLRRQGVNAYPFIHSRVLLERGPDGALRSVVTRDGVELLPLGQISDTASVACNELGENMVYQTDRHGFRNPEGTWDDARIDIVAVGDSFVEGDCVGPDDNMISWVKRTYPSTLNLGVGGTGPLHHLAILKEFARPYRPRVVIWGFYEGAELSRLEGRKDSHLLMRYLGSDFSQRLRDRQQEVDRALADLMLDRMAQPAPPEPSRQDVLAFVTLRTLRARLLSSRLEEQASSRYDYPLFEAILGEAKDLVVSWGGRVYFVYLPNGARFYGDDGDKQELQVMQRRVRSIVDALDIPFVDVPAVFEGEDGPRSLWFHRNSHYNERGYRVAGQAILNALAQPTD
jgi:hypothetical protein